MSESDPNLGMSVYDPGAAGAAPSPGSLYNSLQGFGQEQQAALQQNYQNALGMAQQSLVQSGLAGTSIAPSLKMGYMKQYQLALNNLNSQLTQTKLNAGFQAIGAQQAGQQIGSQAALGQEGLNLRSQDQAFNQQQQAYQNAMNGGGGQDFYSPGSFGPSNPGAMGSPSAAQSLGGAGPTSQFGYWN